jgi:hypothetical protein
MAVAAGGWEACAPDYRVSRPEFPFFSIEYVVAGRGEVTLNGRTHPLAVGSVFSYGPGVAHTIVSDREERLEKYFVDFQGRDSMKAMAGAGLAPGSCGAVLGASRITTVFAELVSLGSSAHAESGRGAALALELLLLAIAQERAGAEAIGAARASFDKCQAQLRGNYLNLQTVNELAEACHLDPAYVCRLYRRFLGQTPYRCLVRRRDGVGGRAVGRDRPAGAFGCRPTGHGSVSALTDVPAHLRTFTDRICATSPRLRPRQNPT